jgi:hypothetical protein
MEIKKQDRALQTPGEANRDKHINFLAEENGDPYTGNGVESGRRSHNEDSESEDAIEMQQKEKRLDPGNEHHHRVDMDDKIFDDDIDRSPKDDADAGGDPTGTSGPEPGEGKNDEPDTSGEDG